MASTLTHKQQTYPSGKVVYYYCQAQTRHTTYPDGIQTFEFESSQVQHTAVLTLTLKLTKKNSRKQFFKITQQVERHFPDGMKEIAFPDGTMKYIYPDGAEERYARRT